MTKQNEAIAFWWCLVLATIASCITLGGFFCIQLTLHTVRKGVLF